MEICDCAGSDITGLNNDLINNITQSARCNAVKESPNNLAIRFLLELQLLINKTRCLLKLELTVWH